jgi:hypothetical protein
MALLDFLIGQDEIDRQREASDRAAREQFDPSQLDPVLEQATRTAQEGIDDEPVRRNLLEQIFTDTGNQQVSGLVGGSQSRGLAFLDKMNQQTLETLGQAESRLAQAESQAKQEGQEKVAQTMAKRNELAARRDAQIAQNRAMAEAEASRRKKQLGATVGKLAGTVAGSALGPLGAAGAGAAVGGILGGGEGAAVGGMTGANVANERQFMDKLFAENEESEQQGDLDWLMDFLAQQ